MQSYRDYYEGQYGYVAHNSAIDGKDDIYNFEIPETEEEINKYMKYIEHASPTFMHVKARDNESVDINIQGYATNYLELLEQSNSIEVPEEYLRKFSKIVSDKSLDVSETKTITAKSLNSYADEMSKREGESFDFR